MSAAILLRDAAIQRWHDDGGTHPRAGRPVDRRQLRGWGLLIGRGRWLVRRHRARDLEDPPGEDQARIAQVAPVGLQIAPVRIRDLRVAGGIAELVPGDLPERVTGYHDVQLGAVRRQVRIRGHHQGPARVDPAAVAQGAAVRLCHIPVEVDDLDEPLTRAQVGLGQHPERVVALGRHGGRSCPAAGRVLARQVRGQTCARGRSRPRHGRTAQARLSLVRAGRQPQRRRGPAPPAAGTRPGRQVRRCRGRGRRHRRATGAGRRAQRHQHRGHQRRCHPLRHRHPGQCRRPHAPERRPGLHGHAEDHRRPRGPRHGEDHQQEQPPVVGVGPRARRQGSQVQRQGVREADQHDGHAHDHGGKGRPARQAHAARPGIRDRASTGSCHREVSSRDRREEVVRSRS